MNTRYQGNLQERLRALSVRTQCPTRQENGQRYLGPPVDWIGTPPTNSEVFISKLPSNCFEDEIYDFCSQAGKIYLLRLMINFENQNRGFCFVTYSNTKEASIAVSTLPQKPLRKDLYVLAEISLNNCTLKMYGLDFRWQDDQLEQEIRANTRDVVNVLIRRNMSQRTLMATLYFDTHQKAAIARRKLSQIANSRWGNNVKVFLWSKKLQNKKTHQINQCNGMKPVNRLPKREPFEFHGDTDYEDTGRSDFSDLGVWGPSQQYQYINSVRTLLPQMANNYYDDVHNDHYSVDYNTNYDSGYDSQITLSQYQPSNLSSASTYEASILSSPRSSNQITDGTSSPSHSHASTTDSDPYRHCNGDTFQQSSTSFLDLGLETPLQQGEFLHNSGWSFDSRCTDHNVDVILEEALAALTVNNNGFAK